MWYVNVRLEGQGGCVMVWYEWEWRGVGCVCDDVVCVEVRGMGV